MLAREPMCFLCAALSGRYMHRDAQLVEDRRPTRAGTRGEGPGAHLLVGSAAPVAHTGPLGASAADQGDGAFIVPELDARHLVEAGQHHGHRKARRPSICTLPQSGLLLHHR